mmetsp:Transcript_24953/g.40088  ORF Transcript_24953/g.40088 Transcript_24953/m.40088 type:complete len:187 (-) Transcript_24953:170-730(-)
MHNTPHKQPYILHTHTHTHTDIYVDDEIQSRLVGIGLTLVAGAISGVASTVMQYNLQRLERNSYLMSAELGFFSACFLILKLLCEAYVLGIGDGQRILNSSFFDGFDRYTVLPLMSTACGGIVVGKVTYHLGGVGKAYGLLAGLVLSLLIHADTITWRLLTAVPLIILAFWLKFARASSGSKQHDD